MVRRLWHSVTNQGGRFTTVLFIILGILSALIVMMPVGGNVAGSEQVGQSHNAPVNDAFLFLPSVYKPLPPTPTPVPPVPDFVTYMELAQAECPFTVGFNAHTGYTYIVNSHSENTAILQGSNLLTYLYTGLWPHHFAAVPNSPRVYITNLQSQVSVVDGLSVTAYIPDYYEPYGVTYNPVNGYTYISDLDSTVQIVNGTTLLKNLKIPDAENPTQNAGWLRGIITDPQTGLVYVASWERGRMYVIDGLDVVASYHLGWKPLNMLLDQARGLIYITHTDPDENPAYPHNISVFSLATQTVTPISTAVRSRAIALDPISGLVYATNPNDNSVTLLSGTDVIGNLPAGELPWGIAVNPNTGYVFVTNRNDNNVTVYKDGAYVKTINTWGHDPFAVGVDTNENYVYIANRGSIYYGDYDIPYCEDASVTILR
jgi:DNA-binding beta-propeller fold protein YncE